MLRLAIAMALACASVAAQGVGAGSITGIASDPSGAVIPGVKITVRNIATNVEIGATANEAGNYLVQNLVPGQYELTAAAPGFRDFVRKDLRVQVAQTLRVDPSMQLGAASESVTVSGAPPLVETETGAQGQTIENRKITQLPINGRNVYSLVNLIPGAAPDQTGALRINGARARGNEYMVDGVTQVTPVHRGGAASAPPIDSIEEFKVLTNSYSAEYGNASGGIINAATKSGTNEVHGTLWEFLRNDKLNTRNFFAPAASRKPVLRYNQFGAAVGGPVYLPKTYDGRNRMFFFANYDATRNRGQSVFNVNVPTAAERRGDFSSALGPVIGTDALGRQVRQGQIYNPFSHRTVDGVAIRDPIPNNVFAPDLLARIDPAARKIIEYFPEATVPGAVQPNFLKATSSGSNYDRYEARIDHYLSSAHRLFGRYSRSKSHSLASVPFRGAGLDTDVNDNLAQNVVLNLTSGVGPASTNEIRGAFLQIKPTRLPYQSGRNIPKEVGIANIESVYGIPIIDIAGYQTIGFNGSVLKENHWVMSLIDNLTRINGRHTIRAGGEYRKTQVRNFQPGAPSGSFAFRSAQTALPGALQARTGSAMASFLLGAAQSYSYTQRDFELTVRPFVLAGYLQDDIRLTRRLTVNLGLRYDFNSRVTELEGRSSTLDLATGRVLAGPAKPKVALDKNNFAPRFGFAYDLTGRQTTVIRGGYGVFYQPVHGGGSNAGLSKFPFSFGTSGNTAGVDTITTLSRGPILRPEYDLNDPRLGFGGSVGVEAPNLAPYVQQWNLGVERNVGRDFLIGVSYVGSASKKLDTGTGGSVNINQVRVEQVREAAARLNTSTPDTARLRPWPDFEGVNAYMARYGDANYHSLQLKAERRMRRGVNLLASYVWSKSIDNGSEVFGFSGGEAPQDIYNLRNERAVAQGDRPHRLVAAFVGELPFGKGRAVELPRVWNFIAGGYELNGIATLQSGRPSDVTQTVNTSRTFSAKQRPSIQGPPALSREFRKLDRFFDTSVFAAAAPLSFGTSPRNPVRGPGTVNFDLGLIKQFPFTEQRHIEFRAEAFNLTNTPAFGQPNTAYNPALPLVQQSFGRITGAGAGRTFQMALKMVF